MLLRICILSLLLAATTICARAFSPDTPTPDRFTPDTLKTPSSERTKSLYDSIQSKSSRRAVPRIIYRMLFVRPIMDTTSSGHVVDESRILEPYAGKTIGEICIDRQEVFNPNGNWFERLGNKAHVLTREHVVRRDLLFKSGDKFNPQLIVRNKQLLRSRSYISEADIQVLPDSLDSTRVNLLIHTRDSWSITIDGGLHSSGRTMIGLYDANVFGTGNKLKFKTNFNRDNFGYGGNMVEYQIPNVLGTFYTADFSAGRDFYNTDLSFALSKVFLKTTDYEVGISHSNIQSRWESDDEPMQLIKARNVDAWGGHSFFLQPIRSSIYFTGHYSYQRHSLRPEISRDYNPAFHGHDNLLFGLGLYRENFYTANMVYGFGTKEYLATGYKAEVVSGYSWGEFNNAMYLGITYKTGAFHNVGYLMGGFTLGSYIDLQTGTWRQSAIDIDLQWFSNLFLIRRTRIRQFLTLSYTQGWNRGLGATESISFTKQTGLQGLKEATEGSNRTLLNTETVVFTPYQPLGFRIAFFGFADVGLIGYSANTFKNDFFASFGLGIRLKNERLIFSTIQIQLGLAVGKYGLVASDYFKLSNGRRLEEYRYLPTRPEIVGFR